MKAKSQFFILLFLLTLIACNEPTPKKNDLILENFSGNIKSINEISYIAKETSNGVIEGPRERTSIDKDYLRKYNIKGYLIEEDRYYSDGKLFENIVYVYDDQENKIEKNILRPGGRPDFIGQIKYLYQNGRLIEEIEFSTTADLIINKKYQFDGKGNVIKEIRSYPNGRSNEIVFKYDNQGNKIEVKRFYPSGELSQWGVYKYDNEGNRTEHIYMNHDGSFSRKDIYKYDNKRNINEIKIFYDRDLEKKINNTYKYDEKGNWVKKIVFENDISKHIVKREIIYYK